jgi:hypothetical protein
MNDYLLGYYGYADVANLFKKITIAKHALACVV